MKERKIKEGLVRAQYWVLRTEYSPLLLPVLTAAVVKDLRVSLAVSRSALLSKFLHDAIDKVLGTDVLGLAFEVQ